MIMPDNVSRISPSSASNGLGADLHRAYAMNVVAANGAHGLDVGTGAESLLLIPGAGEGDGNQDFGSQEPARDKDQNGPRSNKKEK
jgi:hypothetical protein